MFARKQLSCHIHLSHTVFQLWINWPAGPCYHSTPIKKERSGFHSRQSTWTLALHRGNASAGHLMVVTNGGRGQEGSTVCQMAVPPFIALKKSLTSAMYVLVHFVNIMHCMNWKCVMEYILALHTRQRIQPRLLPII